MNIPSDLHYTEDHEWVKVEGDIAIVGVTDFAQDQLGDIVYVDVDTVGESLEAGVLFGSVEAVKTTSELFMPVSGEIVELNEELEADPDLINSDPYGKGWILKIKIADKGDHLISAEDYNAIL